MRTKLMLAAAASLFGGAAHAQDGVGRTFHYERTNIDGSEPEQIYFHRAAPDKIAVYKMAERCTRSALVTATIDPATGEASGLVAAQLRPGAASEPYASVLLDPAASVLRGSIFSVHPPLPLETTVGTRPWHMYDFDLATLGAAFEARAGSRAPMRFGMAMVWADSNGPRLLWLGGAEARFAAAERHLDRDTLRFDVTGLAFGDKGGGPLWIDAAGGQIVDVQWGRPNHDNYKDFRLRLLAEEPAGEAAWTALLRRHFEGCPAPGESKAP
ncbi:MAG: hypothetical protein V4574_05610 [Pseudomonadota bacterium]